MRQVNLDLYTGGNIHISWLQQRDLPLGLFIQSSTAKGPIRDEYEYNMTKYIHLSKGYDMLYFQIIVSRDLLLFVRSQTIHSIWKKNIIFQNYGVNKN